MIEIFYELNFLYLHKERESRLTRNIDDINNICISKFKETLWCDKNLEDTRNLRYYKKVIEYPNLEDQIYLYVLTSVKKKIHIAKIRTNSHALHSET